MAGGLIAGVPGVASADAANEQVAATSVTSQATVARAKATMYINRSRNLIRATGWAKDYTSGRDKVAARLYLQRWNGRRWVNVAWTSWKVRYDYVSVAIPTRRCTNGYYYRAVEQWKWNGRTGQTVKTGHAKC
jgi:hypothetical protein